MNNLPTRIEYKKGIRLEKTAIKIINDVLGGDTTEELMGNFKMIKDKIHKEYNKKDTKKGKRGDDITRLIELILKTNEEREAKYIIENELTGKDDEEKLHDFAEKIKHGKFKNRYPQKIWNNIISIIKNTLKTNEEQVIEQIINELNGTTPQEKLDDLIKKSENDKLGIIKLEIKNGELIIQEWNSIVAKIKMKLIEMILIESNKELEK